jgi:hypothetical protein
MEIAVVIELQKSQDQFFLYVVVFELLYSMLLIS